jgi:hypothetical protein
MFENLLRFTPPDTTVDDGQTGQTTIAKSTHSVGVNLQCDSQQTPPEYCVEQNRHSYHSLRNLASTQEWCQATKIHIQASALSLVPLLCIERAILSCV